MVHRVGWMDGWMDSTRHHCSWGRIKCQTSPLTSLLMTASGARSVGQRQHWYTLEDSRRDLRSIKLFFFAPTLCAMPSCVVAATGVRKKSFRGSGSFEKDPIISDLSNNSLFPMNQNGDPSVRSVRFLDIPTNCLLARSFSLFRARTAIWTMYETFAKGYMRTLQPATREEAALPLAGCSRRMITIDFKQSC